MEPKPTYDIHTDPRNAIVTGDATLVVGPGRVSFHGKVGDLNPQAIADDGAALREQLEQMRKLLVYHLCDCGRDMPPEPHLHAVDCRYRRAVESIEVS
jgi:hypothetical protein